MTPGLPPALRQDGDGLHPAAGAQVHAALVAVYDTRRGPPAIRLVPGAPYAQVPVPGASMKNVIPSWKLC
jgi:hypothetical protein